MCLSIIKTIKDKLIAIIILNGEKIKPLPLGSGMTHTRVPTPPIPMQHYPEFLTGVIR
jgi:hypothetical protein